jgi:hypothetical protein
MSNTQMTQTSIDVLERLSGWTEGRKYEENHWPSIVVLATGEDGVMWMHRDDGEKIKRLEHMDIDGKVFVRDPQ